MGSRMKLPKNLISCSIPSQGSPIHQVASTSEAAPKMDKVKAIITLRSDKKVDQPIPKPPDETKEQQEEEP